MRVKFVVFKDEITALFPDDIYSSNGFEMISCYASIGQHSGASKTLMRCKKATKEQYSDLLRELKNIGYTDLEVMNENYN